MKYAPIDKELFRLNRANFKKLLPLGALAVVNANDILPVNGDAAFALRQNSDLFYLTGIEQEESLLSSTPTPTNPSIAKSFSCASPIPCWKPGRATS